ncbi:MAG: hypothetical protein HUU21_08230 [Polyangiaceae bacterium]|nr:hypothetical protein [Polyangiaceae bacterium]NUQ73527.1 hypothetical protein [Polyangiaceae bacterium]
MPQKPQVRAKNKRRLTRRLAKWRAQNAAESTSQPHAASAAGATKTDKKAG